MKAFILVSVFRR